MREGDRGKESTQRWAAAIAVGDEDRGMTKRLTKAERLRRRRVRDQAWRDRNRAHLVEYFRTYRAEHQELKAYHAAYHQRVTKPRRPAKTPRPPVSAEVRRARKLAKDTRWRRRHPEQFAASVAAARAKRPDLYRQISVQSALKRRARKKAALVERVSVRRVVARDRSTCHLCVKAVTPEQRSLDHLIPIVRGGAHAEWNLMLAHLTCNKRRGIKRILPEETKQAAEAYIAARVAALSETR